jgi:hydroxymethylpyrimidine kinase/phosphomethylpyrimidine kinase
MTAPIAWTIAGSDPGGGAGIQADLKVMSAFGVHGSSVITALTAQNTQGVISSEPVSPAMLRAQLKALETDLPPAVIKTGMLGSAETVKILAEFFQSMDVPIVCDPVLQSTSGSDLLDPEALEMLKSEILPQVAVLTPNIPETEVLLGHPIEDKGDAADKLIDMGVQSALIKGGHADAENCTDFWTNGSDILKLTSPRIDSRHTHGTGCILASAIASAIANGQEAAEAVITAKSFLNQCLRNPANIGSGHGPMMIDPFCNDSADQPNIEY